MAWYNEETFFSNNHSFKLFIIYIIVWLFLERLQICIKFNINGIRANFDIRSNSNFDCTWIHNILGNSCSDFLEKVQSD